MSTFYMIKDMFFPETEFLQHEGARWKMLCYDSNMVRPCYKNITKDHPELKKCAFLIQKYSWGFEYPIHPFSELASAKFVLGVYIDDFMISCGYVGSHNSPDGKDNEEIWLCGAVVHPKYRRQGIFRTLYQKQLSYALQGTSRILTCTSNEIVEIFLAERGWIKIRTTLDESKQRCCVFEYYRPVQSK